jgi:hypothetical protein
MIGFSDDPGAHARVDLAEGSKFETPGFCHSRQARPAPRLTQRKIAIDHAVETNRAIPKPSKWAGTPSARHAAPARPCHEVLTSYTPSKSYPRPVLIPAITKIKIIVTG